MQYEILVGDCIAAMRQMADNSFDSIVTDPPYELGFMGKTWDASGIAYSVEMWREALRVLKPGGHLLAFSGSRTYHRMTCAIEDAGFEIRDQIMWVYGQGFPKSLDVSKAIDKQLGAQREMVKPKSVINHQRDIGNVRPYMLDPNHMTVSDVPASPEAEHWEGWGTALKPAHEPICVARKPLVGTVAANVLQFGTGALNIDGCRVATADALGGGAQKSVAVDGKGEGWQRPWMRDADAVAAHAARVNENVARAESLGRWPANLIHDGSDEVLTAFPDAKGQQGDLVNHGKSRQSPNGIFGGMRPALDHPARVESDTSAARFFYCAKASKSDRGPGNTHPTVKPLALLRYLLRLVTPPGGRALDPFLGSGSTIVAGLQEGFTVTGLELLQEHADIAERRAALEAFGDLLGGVA